MPHVTARHRVSKHKRFFPSEEKPRSSFKRTYPLYYDFHFAHGTSWLQATFSPSLPIPFSRFILMEEEQVWINSVHHGKYLRSKIPPFDISPKEKVTYRSPETKRSRINARLKCRFVFKWLLVSSPEFWDTGRVWKIVEDVLEILQTGMSNY